MLSAAFIMAANSWMQHPVGYKMVDGKPQLNDIWAVLTNPVFLWGYAQVLLASLVTGSVVMLAVSAWQLRRGRDPDTFTRSARLSLAVLVPAIIFAMLVGSELGVIEATYQPMKIAAAEAQWTTCQPCSFSLFQIGGGNNDQTPTEILAIPHLLSLLATDHWNGKVIGLNPLQSQYQQKYGPGYYVPNVFIQYWSMRVMAYIAGWCSCSALWGLWLIRRKTLASARWFLMRGRVGGGAPVPHEHRGLDADRDRPSALDRAGAHADQERCVPVGEHHGRRHQPGDLRIAVRGDRRGGPVPDAEVLARDLEPLPARRTGPTRPRPVPAVQY